MHIALLTDRIPPENRGGAGEVVWRLGRALHRAGHRVTLICATEQAAFEDERDGLHTVHLHSRYPERLRAWLSLYNPQTARPLRAWLRRLRPDVVHAHNIHADLSYHSLVVARQMGIRTVFTSHDVMPFAYTKLSAFIKRYGCDVPPGGYRLPPLHNLRHSRLRFNPARNLWIRRVLAGCDARIAVSQALAQAHADNGLTNFSVVYNGVDVLDWKIDSNAVGTLQSTLKLEGRQLILFGGRMTKAKGTYQLLEALARVVQRVPRALLLVASTTPIEQQVSPAMLAPVRDHVRWAGWLHGDLLAAAYRAAHVIVTPSIIFDSFPTMNLEAMAAGKPVITTCFGGAREAVQHERTGLVLNPFHTNTLAESLERLLTDHALAARMGAAGYERVRSEFYMERFMRLMLEHY